MNEKSPLNCSEVRRENFVLIEDVEASLHISTVSRLLLMIRRRFALGRRRLSKNRGITVSILVASGPEFDKKINTINKRILKKLNSQQKEASKEL